MSKNAPPQTAQEAPAAEAALTSEQHWWQPAPGCRVRKRDGTLLADGGEALPFTSYYARLIADGDIIAMRSTPA